MSNDSIRIRETGLTARYGSLSIGLHWLMLLLLIAVYACMELRVIFPKGSDSRELMKTWHSKQHWGQITVFVRFLPED